jgi:hypothetical protein
MATYVFKYDDAYLMESFDRVRRVGVLKYFRGALKAICLAGLVPLLAASIYFGIAPLAAVFAGLIVILGIGPQIDYYLARRKLRRSVFYNTESRLDIDSTKMTSTYPTGTTESDWKPFSKAIRVKDGFLVYFDSISPHWWPDSALRDGSITDVAKLFREHTGNDRGAAA